MCTREGFLLLSTILPQHEQAVLDDLELGVQLMERLTSDTIKAILFVSHRWLSDDHPDPCGKKLRHLQALIQLPKFSHVLYIWIDYCCISQLKERADNQRKAIDLLAYYARNSTHFVSLYGEIEQRSLWNEYIKRGWCRIEILAATSSNTIKMWKSNIDNIDSCVLFETDYIAQNPLKGDFRGDTNEIEEEKYRIAPMVHRLCSIITLVFVKTKNIKQFDNANKILKFITEKKYLPEEIQIIDETYDHYNIDENKNINITNVYKRPMSVKLSLNK